MILNIGDLPKTEDLILHLMDYYGLSKVQSFMLVSGLNCANINDHKSQFGEELITLFCQSSEEIHEKETEDF